MSLCSRRVGLRLAWAVANWMPVVAQVLAGLVLGASIGAAIYGVLTALAWYFIGGVPVASIGG